MALGCSVGPGKFFRLSGPIMLSSVRTHFPSLLTGQWPGRGLVDGQSQHGRKGFLWPVGRTWAVKKPEQVLGASEGEIPVLRGLPLLPVPDWRSLTAVLPVRDWQCLSSASGAGLALPHSSASGAGLAVPHSSASGAGLAVP